MITGVSIPDHQLLERLREGADRFVFRGRYRGEPCVTRIILRPVPVQLGGLIDGVVLSGVGSMAGFDDEVTATLEGYRVRSRLGDVPGLPDVLAAGLADAPDRCPAGCGLPFVTTRWIPGRPLGQAAATRAEREASLGGVLRILRALHQANTVYGDLKPHNVIRNGEVVHLIDLDTLREVADGRHPIQVTHRTPRYAAPEQEASPPLSYPASDIFTFGLMVCELLGNARRGDPGFPPRLSAPWDAVVDACFRHSPLDRPPADALIEFIDGTIAHLPDWSGLPLSSVTEPVRDRTQPVSEPAAPPPAETTEPPLPPTPPVLDVVTRTISRDGIAPAQTVAVPPPPAPAPAPAPAPEEAPSKREPGWLRRSGLLWLGVLLVIVGAGGGIGAAAWVSHAYQERQEAQARASDLMAALKEHKTVPEKNGLDTLSKLINRTGKALDRYPTAEIHGLYALEQVWQQRWHWGGASWNANDFSVGSKWVDDALQAGETPAALLAKGVLYSGACRTMPDRQAERRATRCAESLDALDKAARAVRNDDELEWFAVEVAWAQVMTRRAEAAHLDASAPGQAKAVRERAREQCVSGFEKLDAAPVNGKEMVESCLHVVGALHDYARYLEWASWLQDHEIALVGKRRDSLARRVVSSVDPACAGVAFTRWPSVAASPIIGGLMRQSTDDERGGDITDLCRYVGAVAMGCAEKAAALRPCKMRRERADKLICLGYIEQDGVPWDEAEAAAANPVRTDCFWD